MGLYYVTLGTNDFGKAKPFYDQLMAALGGALKIEIPDRALSYALPDGGSIWVMRPFNGETATAGNGTTVGLKLDSVERVHAAHAAALAGGGTSEGEPGPRPQYGPAFYAAYVRDPDGNKVSLVHLRTEQA